MGQPLRYAAIDSLRGLASIWVVFYHLWNRFYPEQSSQGHIAKVPPDPIDAASFFLIGYGYIGVTLFFVLSGFCIHLPQAKRFVSLPEEQLAVGDFLRRRFWRLYPAYFASLVLISLILGAFPLANRLLRGVPFDALEAFGVRDAIINAAFVQQLFPDSLGFNGVYWTLVYEVQFYAFYPILLVASRRFGFAIVAVVLFGFELALIFHPVPIPRFFLNRYFEWYLGMMIAERVASGGIVRDRGMSAIGLTAGIAATFAAATWGFRDLLLSIGFAGVLMSVLKDQNRVLASSPLVWLGTISYSLYLVHVPIIDLVWNAGSLGVRYGAITESLAHAIAFAAVPLSLGAAWLSFRWFEQPFFPSRATRSSNCPTA